LRYGISHALALGDTLVNAHTPTHLLRLGECLLPRVIIAVLFGFLGAHAWHGVTAQEPEATSGAGPGTAASADVLMYRGDAVRTGVFVRNHANLGQRSGSR
jgi:hypothetical protein